MYFMRIYGKVTSFLVTVIYGITNLYLAQGIDQMVKYYFRTNIHKPLNYCVMNKNTYCTHESAQIERPEENKTLI
jgi:hypothetical protein